MATDDLLPQNKDNVFASSENQNHLLLHGSLRPMSHDPYGSQSTRNGSLHWCFYIPWWCHQMETFYWPFVRGIHRSPVNSLHKGQWRGTLMFSLIYGWINGWVNNREAGDLRHHHAHYDIIVMIGNFKTQLLSPFWVLMGIWCRSRGFQGFRNPCITECFLLSTGVGNAAMVIMRVNHVILVH